MKQLDSKVSLLRQKFGERCNIGYLDIIYFIPIIYKCIVWYYLVLSVDYKV